MGHEGAPAGESSVAERGSFEQWAHTAPLLEARHVSFSYATTAVLRDVSLAVPRGALCALIGANGSGKSTLLRLLAGLVKAERGETIFDGGLLSAKDGRERAKRIAYVPQTSAAVFPFTGLEVVLAGRTPYSGRFRFESAADERVAVAALAALDASHLAGRALTEMSGGERQMVSVARALAQEPELLLLDEPVSALDLKHRAQLLGTLRRLRAERGITVLMISHDLMLLDAFELLFAMKRGRIVESGGPTRVLTDEVLSSVYDARVRTLRKEGRVFIWSDV